MKFPIDDNAMREFIISSRILEDDGNIIEYIKGCTLEQIDYYINFSTENQCTKNTAALIDYKYRNFNDDIPDNSDEFML